MTDSIHPELSVDDIEQCSDQVQDFLSRALTTAPIEALDNQVDRKELLKDFVTKVLAKQQLFGNLTEKESFTIPTDTPTLLEAKLVFSTLNQSTSNLAVLLDLFKTNPEGTLVDGGPSVMVGSDLGKLSEVRLNLLEDLVLKASVGTYMLRLHSLLSDPEAREAMTSDILEDLGMDKKLYQETENLDIDSLMSELGKAGMGDFLTTSAMLKSALLDHVDDKDAVKNLLLANKPDDMQDVDAHIKIGQLLKILEPILKLADQMTDD